MIMLRKPLSYTILINIDVKFYSVNLNLFFESLPSYHNEGYLDVGDGHKIYYEAIR